MMYYVAKAAQAAGLAVIAIGFVRKFPNLMSHQELMLGILIFGFGWIIESFLLRK